jgi:thymidylate synthase ThyX
VNGESARYKELKADKYHIPSDWPTEEQDLLRMHCEQAFERYHACLKRLVDAGYSRKRAKESARFYLPYANSLTLDVSFNFRSFIHFQRLRNDDHAQLEIHEVAQKMLDLVRDTGDFKFTLDAFGY